MSEKKEGEALKHDSGKIRYSLVPQLAIREVIKGFEHGAKKYGQFNYSNGLNHLRYADAAWRHMNQYLTGENIDEESGVPHLALIACNAMMALENSIQRKGVDDRNPHYVQLELFTNQ
jgi:hypothetical protein